jgi:hypothetical protein
MTSTPACRVAVTLLLAACGGATGPQEGPADGPPSAADAWFDEITEQAGLDFLHGAGAGAEYLVPEIMGSGGALFDHDGDGDLDLYLVSAGDGAAAINRMFSREPDGSYTDVTAASGLGDPGYGMGAALGDVDNDGDLDLLVTNLGPDALYLNAGGGVFRRLESPIGADGWSTSACFLDHDRDGLLDLYVATYLDFDPPRACTDKAGNPEFCGPEAFRGLPDRLYRGRGDGTFEEISDAALPGRPSNKGLGVVCADLDGDGRTDVYVTNDGEENLAWMSRGAGPAPGPGGFENRAVLLGAALNMFGHAEASMGIAAGDVDDDLDLDLFMTHLDRETNTLYLNLGEAGFEDRTATSGLGPAGLPFTGFGTALLDADRDGDLDLVAVNGRVRRGASLAGRAERRRAWQVDPSVPPLLVDYAEPNQLFVNQGAGSFSEAGALAGALATGAEVSRGLLTGDLDGDGDLDLAVTNCGGRARLYRNDAPGDGHWLAVRAIDPALRRDALGAAVILHAAGRSTLRPVLSGLSYLSAIEPEVHFGLGDAAWFDGITVVWPDGTREAFPGGTADRRIRVLKGQGEQPS